MKHEPTPAIHMEKQHGWACELSGVEFLGISKMGQTVLARLMESQIWHQLISFIGEGLRKGIMGSAHLDARHFSVSLYATGAYPSAGAQREWV